MDRGDFGSYGSTAKSAKSRVTFQRSVQDDRFQALFTEATGKIFKINKNVSALEASSRSLGDNTISKNEETKIHSLSQETNKLAKETSSCFKEMARLTSRPATHDEQSNKQQVKNKLQQGKLKTEFENSLSRYHAIQNVLSLKMKSFIDKEIPLSPGKLNTSAGDHYNEKKPLLDESAGDVQEQVQMEEQELEALKEREDRIRQIETDMLDVNEIFRDLAVIVQQQGETIDSIESNIEHAAVHVEEANIQLDRAKKYQKSARKRLCIILVVVVFVAGIIGLIIYLSQS